MILRSSLLALTLTGLIGCAGQPVANSKRPVSTISTPMVTPSRSTVASSPSAGASMATPFNADAMEVVLYALGLLNIDYRFGGSNPEQGLDCSGMVSYIFRQAAGIELPHNAARMAQLGRSIDRTQLEPGDLVFFNTRNKPFSHVGIYIGEEKFVHAPATNGQIKVSSLKNRYFASRYEGGRRYLN